MNRVESDEVEKGGGVCEWGLGRVMGPPPLSKHTRTHTDSQKHTLSHGFIGAMLSPSVGNNRWNQLCWESWGATEKNLFTHPSWLDEP